MPEIQSLDLHTSKTEKQSFIHLIEKALEDGVFSEEEMATLKAKYEAEKEEIHTETRREISKFVDSIILSDKTTLDTKTKLLIAKKLFQVDAIKQPTLKPENIRITLRGNKGTLTPESLHFPKEITVDQANINILVSEIQNIVDEYYSLFDIHERKSSFNLADLKQKIHERRQEIFIFREISRNKSDFETGKLGQIGNNPTLFRNALLYFIEKNYPKNTQLFQVLNRWSPQAKILPLLKGAENEKSNITLFEMYAYVTLKDKYGYIPNAHEPNNIVLHGIDPNLKNGVDLKTAYTNGLPLANPDGHIRGQKLNKLLSTGVGESLINKTELFEGKKLLHFECDNSEGGHRAFTDFTQELKVFQDRIKQIQANSQLATNQVLKDNSIIGNLQIGSALPGNTRNTMRIEAIRVEFEQQVKSLYVDLNKLYISKLLTLNPQPDFIRNKGRIKSPFPIGGNHFFLDFQHYDGSPSSIDNVLRDSFTEKIWDESKTAWRKLGHPVDKPAEFMEGLSDILSIIIAGAAATIAAIGGRNIYVSGAVFTGTRNVVAGIGYASANVIRHEGEARNILQLLQQAGDGAFVGMKMAEYTESGEMVMYSLQDILIKKGLEYCLDLMAFKGGCILMDKVGLTALKEGSTGIVEKITANGMQKIVKSTTDIPIDVVGEICKNPSRPLEDILAKSVAKRLSPNSLTGIVSH